MADIFADVPSGTIAAARLGGDGLAVADFLVECGAAASKGEARRAVEGGGIYLNNLRVADTARRVTASDLLDGGFLVVRHGRRNYRLVRVD